MSLPTRQAEVSDQAPVTHVGTWERAELETEMGCSPAPTKPRLPPKVGAPSLPSPATVAPRGCPFPSHKPRCAVTVAVVPERTCAPTGVGGLEGTGPV